MDERDRARQPYCLEPQDLIGVMEYLDTFYQKRWAAAGPALEQLTATVQFDDGERWTMLLCAWPTDNVPVEFEARLRACVDKHATMVGAEPVRSTGRKIWPNTRA